MSYPLLHHIHYYFTARSSLYIHSPYVFDFCQNVLYAHKTYYAFDAINRYRQNLLHDKSSIEGNDAGSGSHTSKRKRSVSDYARIAGMPDKYGRVLFKSVLNYKSEYILELGTCLGMGTAFMAMANHNAHIISIEGNTALVNKAREGLLSMGIENVTLLNNLFDDVLPHLDNYMPHIDLAFIDGNHTFNATLRYFETLIPFSHAKTILVFDDINWSNGMVKAWKHIVWHPHTSTTINIGRMGIACFDKSLPKQEFILRF